MCKFHKYQVIEGKNIKKDTSYILMLYLTIYNIIHKKLYYWHTHLHIIIIAATNFK